SSLLSSQLSPRLSRTLSDTSRYSAPQSDFTLRAKDTTKEREDEKESSRVPKLDLPQIPESSLFSSPTPVRLSSSIETPISTTTRESLSEMEKFSNQFTPSLPTLPKSTQRRALPDLPDPIIKTEEIQKSIPIRPTIET